MIIRVINESCLMVLDRQDVGRTPIEVRIEELRHRLRIEKAVGEGAKNVIKSLQAAKPVDKKAMHEVRKRNFVLSFYCNICR